MLAAFYGVAGATLWVTGIPRGRTVAVAASWLVQAAATLRFTRRGAGRVELGSPPPGVLALGLTQLSPTSVSLPLKLLLFVAVDGWRLLARALALSYAG